MKLNLSEKDWQSLVSLLRRPLADGKPRLGDRKQLRRHAGALRELRAEVWDARVEVAEQAAIEACEERAARASLPDAQQLALKEARAAGVVLVSRLSESRPAFVDGEGLALPLVLSAATVELLRDQIEELNKASLFDLSDAVRWRALADKIDEAARQAENGDGAEARASA